MLKNKALELSNGLAVEVKALGPLSAMKVANIIADIWQKSATARTAQDTGLNQSLIFKVIAEAADEVFQVLSIATKVPLAEFHRDGEGALSPGDVIDLVMAVIEVNDFADFFAKMGSLGARLTEAAQDLARAGSA